MLAFSLLACAASDPAADPGSGVDEDNDGVIASLDCDDQDPDVQEVGNWLGDLYADRLPEVCAGFCERTLTGSLVLDGFAGPDLSDLSCLVVIGGSVRIEATMLTDLRGLERLRKVGDDLSIADNASLERLDGLDGLHTVERVLRLDANPALGDLSGLGALTSAGGVVIRDHGALDSLDGLEALTDTSMLVLADNPNLADLGGLTGLDGIDGDLAIDDNDALSTLEGLNGMTRIRGTLAIENNGALDDVTALYDLELVGGDLVFERNLLSNDEAWDWVDQIDEVRGEISIGPVRGG